MVSANDAGTLFGDPPSGSPPIDRVSGLSLQISPSYLFTKMESVPQYNDFSQDQIDRMIKRARETKKRYEQQHRSPVVSNPTCQDNTHPTTDDGSTQERVDTKILGVSIKPEPDLHDTPSPLMGSMYGWDLSIPRVPSRGRDAVDVKVEVPEQDLNTALEFKESNPKKVEQVITTKSDPDICAARKHQVQYIASAVKTQDGSDVHNPHLPKGRRVSSKLSNARVQSVYDTDKTNAMPSRILSRPSCINTKRISPYLKLRLHDCLTHLRPVQHIVNRRLPQAGAQPPLRSQPPQDNNQGLPNYQEAPRSSPLYKSCFGLVRCRSSQPKMSVSSLNPTDTHGMNVYNQGHLDNMQVHGTTGAANGLGYGLGRYASSDAFQTIANYPAVEQSYRHGFDDGRAQVIEALATITGMSRNYILDLISSSPPAPVPLLAQPSPRNIHYYPLDPQLSSIFDSQLRSQPCYTDNRVGESSGCSSLVAAITSQLHEGPNASPFVSPMSPLFSDEEVRIQPVDYGHSLPSNVDLGQHDVMPYPVNNPATLSLNNIESSNQLDQLVHLSQVDGLGLELPVSAGAGPGPSSNSKVCQKCGRKFRRPSDLMDHMYKHTKIKRG
ncbi:unnamed protein product [Rhizoctonia solani]|uniref:C2H2-type domain-containing protein n=1 Tax=Rhizoctonia solani TaxID=456999 RepID=A0A8H2XGH4_9AGAM|nr:unnamed protein product [Rhizoctonia solani]